MADVKKEKLEQQFGDASLLLLMDEFAESQGALLLEHYQMEDTKMPENLDQKCRHLIQKYRKESEKSTLLRRTVRRAAKAAMIGLVCLYLCTNLILSVEALRVPFLNFCIQTRRVFSSLTIQNGDETESSTADDDDVMSLPISVPKGYRLEVKQHNHDDYSLIYPDSSLFLGYKNDNEKFFIIHTFPAAGTLSIDTENAEFTQFLLNDMQAIHISKAEDHSLRTIWIDAQRQRIFDISCNGLDEKDFQQCVFEMSGRFMAAELYSE